jgi:hypothetical protein
MVSLDVFSGLRLVSAIGALLLTSAALLACGDDDSGSGGAGAAGTGSGTNTGTTTGTNTGTTTSTGTGGAGGGAGGSGGAGMVFDTAAKINAHLEGKTAVMEGDNIPSHPNGYDENTNFGTATQCYNKVTMLPSSVVWNVTSVLGTLNGAPHAGDTGTCDNAAPGTELTFDSTAILIENATVECFDFTATYVGFAQEGRGQISPNGTTLSLEIFFKDQATGHRCADGAVGEATVTLNGMPFVGDAVQVYTVQ